MRRLALLLALAPLAGAAPAAAQEGARAAAVPPPPVVTPPPPTPPVAPAPQPMPGRTSIRLDGGLRAGSKRYVAAGGWVKVVGSVAPRVANQVVTVSVRRLGGGLRELPTRVRAGRFQVRFAARRAGVYRVIARHAATPQQVAFESPARFVNAVEWRAGLGARGERVRLLQWGLRSLGYALPLTGSYDGSTARGVLVFRKVNGLPRTGYASPDVYSRVLARRGAFKLRYPRAGRHVEFDWSRQVLVLAQGGRPLRTYHTSSGKPSTPTVLGTFRFYTKQPGVNGVGMVNSSYFFGGYAIHGYHSVPDYPASHGCIRVPIPQSGEIMSWIRLGDPIFAYR